MTSDTAQVIHDTIYIHSADAIAIAQQSREFYDSAWTKLIWLISGSFAVIGVAIPLAIQYYQKKKFSSLKRGILKDQERIYEKLEVFKHKAAGSIYFIQAKNSYDKRHYYNAFKDYLFALGHLVKGNDTGNSTLSFRALIYCLNELNKDEIDKVKKVWRNQIYDTLKEIMNKENNLLASELHEFVELYYSKTGEHLASKKNN